MTRLKTFLLTLFLCFQLPFAHAGSVVLFDGTHPVDYCVSRHVSPVVDVALSMMREDLKEVTGLSPVGHASASATLRVIQLDRDAMAAAAFPALASKVTGKREAFAIAVVGGKLVVMGSDGRGTAYGILEISRLAGVSPWVWWGDVRPQKKSRWAIDDSYSTVQSPSVEYRGIFLNDEDWSLQHWSWTTYSPAAPGVISAQTYKQIFKLLLRLRANTIWPGMHGISRPFFLVPGAKEAADSCGIVIGTSHCEPLMRNNVGEWDVSKRGKFNYITNKDNVQKYWIDRLKEVGGNENFYTIGMRGIHDGSMEGVKTLDEKTAALQQVIDDQRKMLGKYVNRDVAAVPQQFVPYKEVLQIMEHGLQVPDDVTLTWCDDNYGYITRLSDSLQQKRSGGAGVYYHLSYWGQPHDYMWLSSTQPGLIYNEMRQAYDHNARKLWIVNVHDMKTAAYDMELFLDMAWDISSVDASSVNRHLGQWLCREFGSQAGSRLLPVMLEYYRLCGIRKPEFMGWSQTELDRSVYPRGWSQVKNTDFSLDEFGDELDRYLNDWQCVADSVKSIETLLPASLRDAYFSHVKYPLLCAAAMSTKLLEAQRARDIAAGSCDERLWKRDKALFTACAKSQQAYQLIRQLTYYYNHGLAGGKWCNSMSDHPRDLYVFYAPSLPVALTDAEVNRYAGNADVKARELGESLDSTVVVRNACQYSSADEGCHVVQSLGHSMCAVALPRGKSLRYEFSCSAAGAAVLRTAVIPTQPTDKGDIRFAVSIDGGSPVVCSFKEKYRSDGWRESVLRGQALRNVDIRLSRGRHTLAITALDDHVVIDQWMIDFRPDRKFYVFPVKPFCNLSNNSICQPK